MQLVLVRPDIPQNTGAILRLGACLATPVDIVHPCGFVLDDRRLRRAGLDYAERANLTEHADWPAFRETLGPARHIALSARGGTPYTAFPFRADDALLLGPETAGLPDDIRATSDAVVTIPVRDRSLNVAQAAAMVLGEALRQTGELPARHETQD